MRSYASHTLQPAIASPPPKSTPPSSKHSAAPPNTTRLPRSATSLKTPCQRPRCQAPELSPLSTPPAGILDLSHLPEALRTRLCPTHSRPSQSHQSRCQARIPKAIPTRSPLSARHRRSRHPRPSRRPQSRLKFSLKREQNPRYRHHNGLSINNHPRQPTRLSV